MQLRNNTDQKEWVDQHSKLCYRPYVSQITCPDEPASSQVIEWSSKQIPPCNKNDMKMNSTDASDVDDDKHFILPILAVVNLHI